MYDVTFCNGLCVLKLALTAAPLSASMEVTRHSTNLLAGCGITEGAESTCSIMTNVTNVTPTLGTV